MRLTCDQLTIYLQDHLAGATFGVQLARRAARSNEGTQYAAFLAGLVAELESDRTELEAVMRALRVRRDEVKTLLASAAEKLGRLKLNGRIVGYAPLSRVLELEGLCVSVEAKLLLWTALRDLAAREPKLDAATFDPLIERAQKQLAGLHERHAEAAREAFAGG